MAVLQKIRVKFGLAISIIIALALLSFIIDPNTLGSALNSMSKKYDVGKIAGKRISYTDFQENIDKFTTIYQVTSGSSVQNEQSQQQIRNAAWQDLVDRYMFVENAKKAGLRVGEDEMIDLTTGSNISPVLAQNPAFADESGAYSPDVLREFLQSVASDNSGSLKTYWNYLQNTVLTQKYYQKYGAIFNASSVVPEALVNRMVSEANTTSDVEYIMIPFPYQDSTVTVSAQEVMNYYKAHKKDYKQAAGRDIEYVVYEVVPSQKDIAATNADIDLLLPEFASTTNMKAFLLKNSDRPYSEFWYKEGELNTISSEINDYVFGNAQDVSPVYRNGNVFRSAKVVGTANVPDSVYVKHILLQGVDAKHLADSLKDVVAKGGNFSALAAEYSADSNSADGGELGNLGWFTQTYTIPGFESCVTAELNKPFVLNTQYGSHVVVVTKRTKPVAKKQVAILEKTALASKETFNDYYAQANRFATIAGGTYDGYKRAVDSTGVYSHTQNNVTESTANYGSVSQAKEITRWVFDAKKGKASNIITVNNNFFFVVAVKDIREEGYKNVNDVAAPIRETLLREKYQNKLSEKIAEEMKSVSSLEELAQAHNLVPTTAEDVAFFSTSQTLEPAFAGAVYNAPVGELCGPVPGIACVYVFKVTNRETGSFFTAEDARNNETQKALYTSQQILPVMMENAEVKDNRAHFF